MPAARSVSDEPAVEMSCASQSMEKSRRRNTANMDGAGALAMLIEPPAAPAAPLRPSAPRARPRVTARRGSEILAGPPGDGDPFAQQQGLLPRQVAVPVDPAVATVAADRAVRRDD